MIVLAEPDPNDMVQAITMALHILPQIDPQAMHTRVSSMKQKNCHIFTILA